MPIRVTVSDGSGFKGAYAPDGSLYVTEAPDSGYCGSYAPDGSSYVTVSPGGTLFCGFYAPNGSRYVTEDLTEWSGATQVVVVSGSIGGEAVDPPTAFLGVNFAGFEYGAMNVNDPDVTGGWNAPTTASLDYYAARGVTIARVPYKIERMQPGGNNTAIGSDAKSLIYYNAVKSFLDAARARGFTVMPEPHNYAKRSFSADGFVTSYYVGSTEFPVAAFADFHARMAAMSGFYTASDEIDLCNEPTNSLNFDGQATVTNHIAWCNACIAAIRNAGLTNLIHVPGMAYSQASGYVYHGTDQVQAGIVDSGNNYVMHLHQYADENQSGSTDNTRYGFWPSKLLRTARENSLVSGVDLCLGEFNATYSTNSNQMTVNRGRNALHDYMHEVNAYPEVWRSALGWRGGGRIDGNDITSLDAWYGGWTPGATDLVTTDGAERDKLTIFKRYADRTVRDMLGSSIDLDLARNYEKGGTFAGLLPVTRSSARPATEENGNEVAFGANVLRRTRRGLMISPAVADDNLVTTQDLTNAAYTKLGAITLSKYTDPADGIEYDRVQMTGDYNSNFQYNIAHGSPATQSLQIKTLGSGDQYIGMWGNGDKNINVDGAYPKNTWFTASHVSASGTGIAVLNRGAPTDFLVRRMKINLGASATAWVAGAYSADDVTLAGALLTALQGDCTIMIQTRDLDVSGLVLPILGGTIGGTEVALLQRNADGSLSTVLGGALATATQSLGQWGDTGSEWGSRRVGLSKRASAGRVVIGATGVSAVGANVTPGAITAAALGRTGATYLNGLIERVTVYPAFMDTAAMDALLA